ncbi:MAG TPA: fatty acid desaturase [Thermoanaerobaculia bacterium]|nr:fatty acid desaturase [Thermoanaerobaculia bacterium]
MAGYYADHTIELRRALAQELPNEALRELHHRRPLLHFFVTLGLVLALAASMAGILLLDRWYLWLPLAVVSGFAIFNFTVLLPEVVHRAVFREPDAWKQRLLGHLYAVPSGISATQFTKWHLDHHAALGSYEEDPKRHHLSPKINARWYKLLYYTPALFFIYFRAAKQEATEHYTEEMQRTIRRERNLTILFHLSILAAVGFFGGWFVAWKVYVVPVFFVFPVAFSLNRLGQHYDIDPLDPAQWSTLVRGSWFWDVVFLCSDYHLEHHYFPGVPLYNLPRLQRLLMPFYREREIKAHGYGELFWNYIVLNQKPHTNWHQVPSVVGPQSSVAN